MTATCTPLTEKRHSLSWRSSTSLTSTHMFLFVGACQAPASVPRPGRHGRTLLANCRHSGQVNSPLSTEKPWRTWSFWRKWDESHYNCLEQRSYKRVVYRKDLINSCSVCSVGSSTLLLPSETPYRTSDNLYAKCVHRSGRKRPHPNLLTQTADKSSVEFTREKTSVRLIKHSASTTLDEGPLIPLYSNK